MKKIIMLIMLMCLTVVGCGSTSSVEDYGFTGPELVAATDDLVVYYENGQTRMYMSESNDFVIRQDVLLFFWENYYDVLEVEEGQPFVEPVYILEGIGDVYVSGNGCVIVTLEDGYTWDQKEVMVNVSVSMYYTYYRELEEYGDPALFAFFGSLKYRLLFDEPETVTLFDGVYE